MKSPDDSFPWYLDLRNFETSEKISLDLARHMQQRSAVGPVLVVCERPLVMLPVIRKRWIKVIHEVERQRSSTLDSIKRISLQHEIERMRELTFAANTAYVAPPSEVIFTSADHPYLLRPYSTVYLTASVSATQLQEILTALVPQGVIVSYVALEDI